MHVRKSLLKLYVADKLKNKDTKNLIDAHIDCCSLCTGIAAELADELSARTLDEHELVGTSREITSGVSQFNILHREKPVEEEDLTAEEIAGLLQFNSVHEHDLDETSRLIKNTFKLR